MIENTFIKQSQCMFSGCPSVIHKVDLTLPWRSRDVYCDPLAFYSGTSAPPALREWAIHARIPSNAYNHGTIARQDNTSQDNSLNITNLYSSSRHSHSFSCSTLSYSLTLLSFSSFIRITSRDYEWSIDQMWMGG